jgi:hypothetical protein
VGTLSHETVEAGVYPISCLSHLIRQDVHLTDRPLPLIFKRSDQAIEAALQNFAVG